MLIFDNNLLELLRKGIQFEYLPNKNEKVIKLMEHVRDNHTYINRINTIMKYINEYTNFVIFGI